MSDESFILTYERLPKLLELVEVKFYGCDEFHEAMLFPNDDDTYYWKYKAFIKNKYNKVICWRPIPAEKRHFGKLRQKDIVILSVGIELIPETFRIFIDDGDILVFDNCKFSKDLIKKITRINIAEQKFEEI